MGKLTLAFLLLVILMLIAPMILYKEHFLDQGSYLLPPFVTSALAGSPASATASSAYVSQLASYGTNAIPTTNFAYQDFVNIQAALAPISGSPGFPTNLATFIASTPPPPPVVGSPPPAPPLLPFGSPPPAAALLPSGSPPPAAALLPSGSPPPAAALLPSGSPPPAATLFSFGSPPPAPTLFSFDSPPPAPPLLPFGSPPSGPLPPLAGSIFATPTPAATNAAAAPTYSPASLFAPPAPTNAAAAPTYSPASLFAPPAPPPLADGTCSDNATPCFMSNNNAKGTNSTDCPVAGNGTQNCYANPPPLPNNGTCSDNTSPCYTGNDGADCPDGFQFCTLYSSPAPAPASPINPTVVGNLLSNMMAQSTPPGSINPKNSSNLSSGSYQYNPITSTWAFGQPSPTNPMQFAVPMYDSTTGTYTSPSILQGQTYQAQQAGMNPADYVRKDSIPCYGCAFPTITGNSANSCL